MPESGWPAMDDEIIPYRTEVPETAVADLRRRLRAARWPDRSEPSGWQLGCDTEFLRDLCNYWAQEYNWRRAEAEINSWPSYTTQIDGERIHFLHVRSPRPDAIPLLMLHGWPGSIYEFHQVIGPLSEPHQHAADQRGAFHVVCMSLPGFGFSGPTTQPGWDMTRVARAAAALMERLGYTQYGVQGGDWGATIGSQLARTNPGNLIGLHLNLVNVPHPASTDDASLSEQERGYVRRAEEMRSRGMGYLAIQSTRPAALSFGLLDSPVGLAAWILDKFFAWSDCEGDLLRSFSRDQLLTNLSIYWFTKTIGSSVRLYYETAASTTARNGTRITVPTACALFPAEPLLAPRSWVERVYNLVRWSPMPSGGHFAAFEQPVLFVEDVRSFFESLPL